MSRINRELFVAAGEKNVPEIRRLLSVGADIESKDNYGNMPLHWACKNGHSQVVKELLDHGADIEAKNNFGRTPLHWACYNGHVAIVNELLTRGANTEVKTYIGDTPLHWASHRGHFPVVKALMSGGADILAANDEGQLPIHLAVRRKNSTVAKYLVQEFYATISRLPLHELLKDLTWIGDPNSSNDPPLFTAFHRNVLGTDDVVEILEFLVDRDPSLLRSRDPDHST
jgi:ankyrin repeat protein